MTTEVEILQFLHYHPLSKRTEINSGLTVAIGERTLKRIIAECVERGLVEVIGKGPATRYKLTPQAHVTMPLHLDTYFDKDIDERQVQRSFNFELIREILPKVQLFTQEELDTLYDAQKRFTDHLTDMTAVEYRKEMERLGIDLSWKSSQIEGHTYSLLETERLLKEKIVTQSDYNTALENYEKARIEYESVLNSKANAGNTIKSPISGYVQETLVSNGDYVNAGDPIAKVVRNNKMMLVADVPLRYQNKLSMVKSATFVTEGSEEVFHTDSLEGKKLPCSTGVSTSNAFITLRWEMNRTAGLWSGSFAKIYLHTETVSDAISIPVTALTDEGGTYYVYVKLDNSHYKKTRVKTGATDGQRIQIVEGLHAGNHVVTEGVMCVRQAGMSKIIGGHGHSH